MSRNYAPGVTLASSLLALLLLSGAAPQPRGEIVGDDVYVNCDFRVAAQFPTEPKFRDVVYRDGARTAPARQFYVERDSGLLSVTVVNFPDGPELDPKAIANAADTLRARGEVRFDFSVFYDDPGIPGRQLQMALPNGRFLLGSVYMAKRRLYITEAISPPNDFPALLFSQSVSLIDENGTDLDTNPINVNTNNPGTSAGLPSRQYDCSRLNRR
jgi:hypothetical protein